MKQRPPGKVARESLCDDVFRRQPLDNSLIRDILQACHTILRPYLLVDQGKDEHIVPLLLTDSARRNIDFGEHGGAPESLEVKSTNCRADMPWDRNGKKLTFPVYR